jgi:hypothetical protein
MAKEMKEKHIFINRYAQTFGAAIYVESKKLVLHLDR